MADDLYGAIRSRILQEVQAEFGRQVKRNPNIDPRMILESVLNLQRQASGHRSGDSAAVRKIINAIIEEVGIEIRGGLS